MARGVRGAVATRCPVGLGLIGLPRWYGKRFERAGDDALVGVNLLRAGRTDGYETRLAMRVVLAGGLADDLPSAIVSYAIDSPRPWRWARDELRFETDECMVGMSMYAGMRLPFRLHRE